MMAAPVMLMVEDNPGDVVLFVEAMETAGIEAALRVVSDGVEAMEYLRQSVRQPATTPRPDVVVLDLNLPRKTGKEVLREMRDADELRDIPVAVLTSAQHELNICDEYNRTACIFFAKSGSFDELKRTVRQIADFASNSAAATRKP